MRRSKQLQRQARQMLRFCLVRGLVDETRVHQAVQKILEDNHRRSFALLFYFLRLLRLESARHAAEVESTTALPEALRASILSNLQRVYGPGLSVRFALNPGLIGGMRIQVGSDVYDGSVRSGLASLRQRF